MLVYYITTSCCYENYVQVWQHANLKAETNTTYYRICTHNFTGHKQTAPTGIWHGYILYITHIHPKLNEQQICCPLKHRIPKKQWFWQPTVPMPRGTTCHCHQEKDQSPRTRFLFSSNIWSCIWLSEGRASMKHHYCHHQPSYTPLTHTKMMPMAPGREEGGEINVEVSSVSNQNAQGQSCFLVHGAQNPSWQCSSSVHTVTPAFRSHPAQYSLKHSSQY